MWLVAVGTFVWPAFALASGFDIDAAKPTNLPTDFASLSTTIPKIFTVTIVIAGVVFMITFLIGSIRYLSNAGDMEATSKAKKLMVDAIIGLVLTLAAWALANFIYTQLTGRQFQDASSGNTTPTPFVTNPTPPVAGLDPNQGHFCAGTTANCATVNLAFTDGSGQPAAGFRFQTDVTPPATADSGLWKPALAHAASASQSSQILTADTSGHANVTVLVGTLVGIKNTSGIVLQTTTASQALQTLVIQVTSVEKRQVNFKFEDINSLADISNYQFFVKDKTGQTLAGPLTTSATGSQQANLPKGEVVSLTTTDGVILFSDTVPDDNGRVWTIFLHNTGKVAFRIQITLPNATTPPLGLTAINVQVGTAAKASYLLDLSGFVGPITTDVGTAVVATAENDQFFKLSPCSFIVPPRNATVVPCTATAITPPSDSFGGVVTPTSGPPATPR